MLEILETFGTMAVMIAGPILLMMLFVWLMKKFEQLDN